MINDLQKEEITKTLGFHYSKKIIDFLNKKGFKPDRSETFTNAIIQKIVNGHVENLQIEIEILKFVKQLKAKQEKLQQKQQSILS